MAAVRGASLAAAAGMKIMRLALISTGIGAIVVALGAAAAWIVENWDEVKAFFLKIWDSVKPYWEATTKFFSGIWQGIAGFLSSIWQKIYEIAGGFIDAIMEVFRWAYDSIVSIFTPVANFFKDIYFDTLPQEEAELYLDEIIEKLSELQRKNETLSRKYKGDNKFTRIHKRIREVNVDRKNNNLKYIVSDRESGIMDILLIIKTDLDKEVYDRNDILKKDAYFEKTVLSNVTSIFKTKNIVSEREDRFFIMDKIKTEYLNQYNETYMM